jgi:hypothetical protein
MVRDGDRRSGLVVVVVVFVESTSMTKARQAAPDAPPGRSGQTAAGRRTLIGLFLVCLLPVCASYFFYYVAPPSGRSNYGSLVDPQVDWPSAPAGGPQLRGLDGALFDFARLRGKWVLVTIDRAGCDTRCAEKLYMLRQQRLMLNKDRDRVERLWLIIDDAAVESRVLSAYEGMYIARARVEELRHFMPLPVGSVGEADALVEHIFVIDPIQHIMMRYPAKPDPDAMKRDLARLLKASRVG